MGDSVLFRFSGQAGYKVDTGHRKKIRVVFGMIDEKRTSMAWYLFSSDGEAKSKRELANPDKMPPEQFGHRNEVGRDIPQTFNKKIGLDELAIHAHGTRATLTLEISETQRFIECRIDRLVTKANETVTFPFGLQFDSDPARTDKVHGKVLFLETAPFDSHLFGRGPQGIGRYLITGPSS